MVIDARGHIVELIRAARVSVVTLEAVRILGYAGGGTHVTQKTGVCNFPALRKKLTGE